MACRASQPCRLVYARSRAARYAGASPLASVLVSFGFTILVSYAAVRREQFGDEKRHEQKLSLRTIA
jgi:hypothetical protein